MRKNLMIAPKIGLRPQQQLDLEFEALKKVEVSTIIAEYQSVGASYMISGPSEPVFLEYLGLTPTKPVVIPKRKYTKSRRAKRNDDTAKVSE